MKNVVPPCTARRNTGEKLNNGLAADGVRTGRIPEFVVGAPAVSDGGVKAGVASGFGVIAGDCASGTLEALGLAEGENPGDRVGASAAGPGAGRGEADALHWRGTPGMLQARGRAMTRVRLKGI